VDGPTGPLEGYSFSWSIAVAHATYMTQLAANRREAEARDAVIAAGAALVGPIQIARLQKKTRETCRFFLKGECRNDTACRELVLFQ
jgi:hypothetical protein